MTVRTNLAVDPDATSTVWTQVAGTGGAAATTNQTATPPATSASYRRVTWSTATTAASGGIVAGTTNSNRATVAAGTTYTGSLQVRCSKVQRLQCQIAWYNSAGTLLSTSLGTATVLAANTWTSLSCTAAAPATAVAASVQVIAVAGTSGTTWAVGNTLEATSLLVEASAAAGVFFSGADPADGWFYSWNGTANASTSKAVQPQVVASLLTLPEPTFVQLVLSDMPAAAAFTVVGSAGGYTWPIPAGSGTSTGVQVVRTDARAPLNGPITYQLNVAGFRYDSNPVTVPLTTILAVVDGRPSVPKTVLQTLDGQLAVPVYTTALDERDIETRAKTFTIAGRATKPSRYDLVGGESGTLTIAAPAATTALLKTLIYSGAPVVRRNTVGWLDVPVSELIQFTGKVHHRLYAGSSALREWVLDFEVVDDPEPSVAAAAFDWDDFDAVYAASTWAGFDAEWAVKTWDDFDRYDWGQRL